MPTISRMAQDLKSAVWQRVQPLWQRRFLPILARPSGEVGGPNGPSEHIRIRAYELWEQAGRPVGLAESHWLQAEAEYQAKIGVDSRRIATTIVGFAGIYRYNEFWKTFRSWACAGGLSLRRAGTTIVEFVGVYDYNIISKTYRKWTCAGNSTVIWVFHRSKQALTSSSAFVADHFKIIMTVSGVLLGAVGGLVALYDLGTWGLILGVTIGGTIGGAVARDPVSVLSKVIDFISKIIASAIEHPKEIVSAAVALLAYLGLKNSAPDDVWAKSEAFLIVAGVIGASTFLIIRYTGEILRIIGDLLKIISKSLLLTATALGISIAFVWLASRYAVLGPEFGDFEKLSHFDPSDLERDQPEVLLRAAEVVAVGIAAGALLAKAGGSIVWSYFKEPWQKNLYSLAILSGAIAGAIIAYRNPFVSAIWITDPNIGIPWATLANALIGAALGSIAGALVEQILAAVLAYSLRSIAVGVAVLAALVIGEQRGWVRTNGIATQIENFWNKGTRGVAGTLAQVNRLRACRMPLNLQALIGIEYPCEVETSKIVQGYIDRDHFESVEQSTLTVKGPEPTITEEPSRVEIETEDGRRYFVFIHDLNDAAVVPRPYEQLLQRRRWVQREHWEVQIREVV
jgi:Protein of unknown function (DUF2934)